MNITINGKTQPLSAATVQELLQALGLEVCRVAVEHNRDIVPRERFAATALADGDALEIVQFVGGG